ncbi:putative transporter (major facilitator superfamily) [Handroanthus impetiginosus]|uniref:Putative transporter (Major facilitator superfamily) n=1 Tax=Handroanthus impetiginosus TaxID=429701 RepID=A0A2G9GVG2_9LAMI|nr:putative transporter (major facilitator superfamily) [Handroanthus impetiginosus]
MNGKPEKNGAISTQSNLPIPDFDPPKIPKRNKYALACSFLASMTSVLLGYDIGVMSGAIIYIQKDLKISDVQKEVIMGIFSLYSLIGSTIAGRTSDGIGRRLTIVFAGAIFFIGALLMGFATNYAFLMVGRLVAGIGVGYALMIAPVYTAELAPASCRGFLLSFPEAFINVGILLGYVSNLAFSKLPLNLGWRLMLGIGIVPSLLLIIVVFFMPESPRWLVLQGRLGEAKRVLDKTSDSSEESKLRLADIKEAAGIPEHCNDDVVSVSKQHHGEGVWRELLLHPTPTVRHILLCALGLHFFEMASGIESVVLYSPEIFRKAGIKNNTDILVATMAVGFVKLVFISVATFFLDKIGRRPLLLTSVGGCSICLMALATGLTIVENSDHRLTWAVIFCVVSLLFYVSIFACGLGPITWVYGSEIFPLRLRAQGCSLAIASNRITSALFSMTFISLYKAITIGGAFFLYSGITAIAWVFIYTLFPETKGRTLEEMESLFGSFFSWRSTSRALMENNSGDDLKS